MSLVWKPRKKPKVIASLMQEFAADADAQEERELDALDEWMRKQASENVLTLEDGSTLSRRRQEEACVLADAGRYQEAISRLQEAIELTPDRSVLYELQAQCFMEAGNMFEAVMAAEKAVGRDPAWPVALQTLGRAQMNLGEVELALGNFRRALELDPDMSEVREKDLPWAEEVLEKKQRIPGAAAGEQQGKAPARAIIGGGVCLSYIEIRRPEDSEGGGGGRAVGGRKRGRERREGGREGEREGEGEGEREREEEGEGQGREGIQPRHIGEVQITGLGGGGGGGGECVLHEICCLASHST
eukprot:745834-Hanusia_phi.AAC.1